MENVLRKNFFCKQSINYQAYIFGAYTFFFTTKRRVDFFLNQKENEKKLHMKIVVVRIRILVGRIDSI